MVGLESEKMKTKVVYVLVSQENDYYYEMLLLSLYSLRLYHPKDIVEVVMDEETHQRLIRKQASMLNEVTPIVVSIPSEYTVMQRSRYLKTQIRQFVKGNFLFVDTDTIICESLAEIDEVAADVSMVANGNNGLPLRSRSSIELCNNAGFANLEGQPYYNSGIIYSKDTNCARQFFNHWHHLWYKSRQTGVNQDQPSLCQANIDLDYPIKELPMIWNCHVGDSFFLPKVKIIHYFSFSSSYRSILFKGIRTEGFCHPLASAIIQKPRTVGYSLLTMRDLAFNGYLSSEMVYIYETIPKLFHFMTKLSYLLNRPILLLVRVKNFITKKFQ